MSCHAKDIFNAVFSSLLIYCFIYSTTVSAAQYSVISDLAVRTEYNDNIFLTTLPHSGVSNLSVSPAVKILAKDNNWESSLKGRLRSNNYSDHNLDSNDLYLDLSNTYKQELNIYSLSGTYDKDSNLNPESTDFGITGRRVNRKLTYLTPQYQRLITERLVFSASYKHTNVDYTDAVATAYVPYNTNTLTGSLVYGLTENDKLNFTQQVTDYVSKNDTFKYHLVVSQIGVDHVFSETLSSNFSIGTSRRNSSNTVTQSLDFFGQPIIIDQVSDYSDRGSVYNAKITKTLEAGSLTAGLSRNNDANSYGGLNVVNVASFNFDQNISSLWSYKITTRYNKTKAVSTADRFTNRDVLTVQPHLFYTIGRHWAVDATYRYVQRKFDSNISDKRTPHSNMIYIGIRYNFPDISTY